MPLQGKKRPVHKANVGDETNLPLDFQPKKKAPADIRGAPPLPHAARRSALQLAHDLLEKPEQHGESAGAEDRWVEISVCDTGKGVPQQVLNNLFEPFVTTRQKGTGLGLAISQRIVSAARGKIVVQTRQGQGSTFTVRLPAALSPQAEASASASQPGEPVPASGAVETPSVSATNR